MSRIRLPPICILDLSSSGTSYWFSKQLDMNPGELSLTSLPRNTNISAKFTTDFTKLAFRKEQVRSMLHTLLHSSVLFCFSNQKKEVIVNATNS